MALSPSPIWVAVLVAVLLVVGVAGLRLAAAEQALALVARLLALISLLFALAASPAVRRVSE